ncbi:unnamed protein product, partial [Rotaria socialis]
FNKFIDYLNPRPEYIRAIIEWPTKSSIPVAHIVTADIQCSLRLLGARRPEGLLCLSSKADADLSFFNGSGYAHQGCQVFRSQMGYTSGTQFISFTLLISDGNQFRKLLSIW